MIRRKMVPFIFLSPFLILLGVFLVYPIFYSFYLSLFIQKGLRFIYVGMFNYTRILQDTSFFQSIGRMAFFGAIQIPTMIGLALLLALFIDESSTKGKSFFRLSYFLPYAVPGVISALIWGYIYAPTIGPLRQILKVFGLNIDFLASESVLYSIMSVVTWQWTGYNMIFLFSGLKAIPPELYAAAKVDGASNLSIIRYIKLPLLKPALVMVSVFSIIGTFQIFNEPYIFQELTGAIGQSYTPNLYVYNTAFSFGNFTYSATLAWVLATTIFIFSFIFMYLTSYRGQRKGVK